MLNHLGETVAHLVSGVAELLATGTCNASSFRPASLKQVQCFHLNDLIRRVNVQAGSSSPEIGCLLARARDCNRQTCNSDIIVGLLSTTCLVMVLVSKSSAFGDDVLTKIWKTVSEG